MPAAPLFAFTCFQARARFSGARTSFNVYPRELALMSLSLHPSGCLPAVYLRYAPVHCLCSMLYSHDAARRLEFRVGAQVGSPILVRSFASSRLPVSLFITGIFQPPAR